VREYETTFIVQPEISEEGSQAILTKLDGILAAQGADRLMCEDLGKRKLAYEIRKFHKGHYYILSYLNDGGAVPDLERALRLDESILRFLTIQSDDEVTDIESRKASAQEREVEQQKRAAERAAREAEEAAARQAAEEKAAAERAAAGETGEGEAAAFEGASDDESEAVDTSDDSDDSDEDGAGEDADDDEGDR